MRTADQKELEQMALLAELGRPLVHECNNFLNNLFLQMAILVAELPAEARAEWGSIRREGKKVANLLQEWQRHRPLSMSAPETIDLNQVVQEMVADLQQDEKASNLNVVLAPTPLWFKGFRGELKRLGVLMLHHALALLEADGRKTSRHVTLQTMQADGKIQLQIVEAGAISPLLRWSEFQEPLQGESGTFSLTAASCKSLAERLHGSLHVEKRPDERNALIAEFPYAVS